MQIDEAPIGYVGWILSQIYEKTDTHRCVIRGDMYGDWSNVVYDQHLSSEYEYLRACSSTSIAHYTLLIECKKTASGWELNPVAHWYDNKALPLI